MSLIWTLSVLILLLTILLIIYLHYTETDVNNDYKYLGGAIGLSGFTFAILGENLFVEN